MIDTLDAYAESPRLVSQWLRALFAAAEEEQTRAATARRIWPQLLERVVEFAAVGGWVRSRDYFEQLPLVDVIPTPTADIAYHYRELAGSPIRWADPEALASLIERWLEAVPATTRAVDALLLVLNCTTPDKQARLGLAWIEKLVLRAPKKVAGSYLLSNWLETIRPHATAPALLEAWHRVVDALTVAGDVGVARLAD